MKAVIQRVSKASVTVDGEIAGKIDRGLVVLLGVGADDEQNDAILLAEKIVNMRIFSDHEGRFNLSVLDINGELLAISQFTLYADIRRGRRPSFSNAARPEIAAPLVNSFIEALRGHGLLVASGVFGAHMVVDLQNDGPVTLIIDSAAFKQPRSMH
jgi:D-aminoacyl-tRNA deacylase